MQSMLDLILILSREAGPEHCWIDGSTKPIKETVLEQPAENFIVWLESVSI